MTKHLCALALVGLTAGALGLPTAANAGISYTTTGSTYTESFNSFPTNVTTNASLEPTPYASGWQDDVDPTVSTQNDISIPGWHLFHPTDPGDEDGFNGHQRLRIGTGANTGSFWAFGASPITNTERALGSVGSTTVAPDGQSMYMGLQLVNNTGETLHSFTLTFDGEQWRDGASAGGETLSFDYSIVADDDLWTLPGSSIFTPVPALNFAGPIAGGTSVNVDGNGVGKTANITATVTGLSWEPGKELWLRWGDPQLASTADDGLAIDEVRFSASAAGTPSAEVASVISGVSSSGATWSNSAPPSAGNKYRVASGHTVTVDSAFAGDYLRVGSGGTVSFNDSGNAQDIRVLVLDPGSTLTESVSGDFFLGDPGLPGSILAIGADQTINASPGTDLRIDMAIYGKEDLTFNSNGAGSDLLISNASNHDGTIFFNGSGDNTIMFGNPGVTRLEMNSTGANTLQYFNTNATGGGVLAFNQPGRIELKSNSTGARLVQLSTLVANAAVTVDLTQAYTPPSGGGDERRLNFTDSAAISGSGNILVQGSPFDTTDVPLGVSLNEFEIGSTAEPTTIQTDTYTGAITTQDYVSVELRHNIPGARIVVGDNGRVEIGHQEVGTAKTISLGEVQINAGGTFEVGFEQVQNGTGNNGTGNHVSHLNLVTTSGRAGTLAMANGGLTNPSDVNSEPAGSMLVMQVNGKDANQFDTIAAGSVALDGVLKVLVNPPSSILGNPTATPAVPATRNPIYTPQLGDIIPLITAGGGGAGTTADFNDSNTVDGTDLTIWQGAFGETALGDADSDGDSDGNDFLLWQRQLGNSAAGGITGTFDDIVFVDINNALVVPADPHPDTATPILVDSEGVMASLGLKFQVQYTSTAVNLVVVSSAGIAAIPEPTGMLLAAIGSIAAVSIRRRRSA